jgi:hypothetical protein
MHAVAARGRWIWVLSGLLTIGVFLVPATRLIASAGPAKHAQPQVAVTRTVTVSQPVTSLSVQSGGAPVQITAGPAGRVRITETIAYDAPGGNLSASPQPASAGPASTQPASDQPVSGAPSVVPSVSGGRLSLSASACAASGCSVSFAVTAPPGVTATVMTEGGAVILSGIAGANVDSGGAPVSATKIGGALTVSTGGGSLGLDGLAGPLRADTGGGPLTAAAISGTTATVSTGGGSASMTFSAAPDSVTVSTDGGPARLAVPGGPYALTADSDGGPQSVGIATNPAAARSITVTTDSGYLQLVP